MVSVNVCTLNEMAFCQLAGPSAKNNEEAITEGAEAMLGNIKSEEVRWCICSWVRSY